MSLPGNDLLLEIQNAQDIQTLGTKLGVYMRSYVAPSIQNRGLPGQVLATPSDKVGNVSLQSISSLVGTVNPKNASYVGTNASGFRDFGLSRAGLWKCVFLDTCPHTLIPGCGADIRPHRRIWWSFTVSRSES